MSKLKLELFTVCYDERPKDWDNSELDTFFPWSSKFHLSFVVRGFEEESNTFPLTFRVYKGMSDDVDDLPLLYDSIDNYIDTNDRGFFYSQIHSEMQLSRPSELGQADNYTAVVLKEDVIVGKCPFQVANVPPDASLLLKPVKLTYDMKGSWDFGAKMTVWMTFQSQVAYPFFLLIGAYYPQLSVDQPELYATPMQKLPPCDFNVVDMTNSNTFVTVKFEFHVDFDDDEDDDEGKKYYFILTVAGKTFFRMPASEMKRECGQDMLAPFIVSEAPATPSRHQLMPSSFADLLFYLDKRRVFDAQRGSNHTTWKRRHLVLTGKKGTGKRTAAHLLGSKLISASVVQDSFECNAIDLLDPTNGYSPKIEETLDQNEKNLLIVNNAEALTLKGSVGSLTGIEILANKLLKMSDITVVLLGKKGLMEELIKMCEPARDLFYTFYDFDDVAPDVMTDLSVDWLKGENFNVTDDAQQKLYHYFERAYSLRGTNFANMYMARQTIDDEILPRLVHRTISDAMQPIGDVSLITADDIPQAEERDPSVPLAKLESLIGLDNVKQSIINHTSLVRLNKIRADRGLYNRMPPMHMVFTGNPGTGKTTIAEYLGEIYRGIGALSSGHLVQTDRSKLVGQYIGDTEKNTLNAIQRASGGVLFIDEAYNLFVKSDDNRDFGMRVIETLLTYLSMEDTDMIVILAGYTNEMKRLIESNPGLKSRFPYIFHFEDYSPDQLLRIGKLVLDKEQYVLTDEAERALSDYVVEEYNQKDEHFGNGRFITRLLKSHIIPAMSQRLNALPASELTNEALRTIQLVDIPKHEGSLGKLGPIDESILKNAFVRLDALIGVGQAKQALHDYVTTVRMEREAGALTPSSQMLYWNFIGNTGTGKSTVAEILGKLMQGLGLLKRGHTVTLNIEELNQRDMYDTLEKALKRAADGLLFMDMDSPRYRNQSTDSIRTWLVNKIKDTKQQTAVVFAEVGESNDEVLRNLALNGFASLYHSVIFDDFTSQELMQLLSLMLSADYRLALSPEASDVLAQHVEATLRQATRNMPANARTIQMMAQTIAQSARLRIAEHPNTSAEVIPSDLHELKQMQSAHSGRIGF